MTVEQGTGDDRRLLLIDCGLMFPGPDLHGIDLVLPDFTYLRDNADRIDGLVATHGHEDHVGGLQFLLREVSMPIYGSALTLGLARIRELAKTGGVRVLLCDSTNAEEAGHAPSERSVGRVLRALFEEHRDRRIITASFASHLHRIQQIADAAVARGRKVATLGMS